MRHITLPLSLFCLLFVGIVSAASCGGTNCKDPANATSAKCTLISATVTCGGSAVDQLVTEQGPGLEQALGSAALGDGTIDYNKAAPTLEQYAMSFGMCFVTKVFDHLGDIKLATAPGSSSSAAPRISPASAKATYEQFRATHYTGVAFKPAGTP